MQLNRNLDRILLDKIENNLKSNFEKIKEFPKYLDERLREIRDKTYYGLRKVKDGISKYAPIIKDAAIAASPPPIKISYLAGLYARNSYGGVKGKVIGYVLIWLGAAVTVGLGLIAGLHAIHPLSSLNHVEYLGSPNGYEAFVPKGTINYDGHINPTGTLILPNETIINHVIWNGQYANTIIQNHEQIVQLNSIWVTNNNSWASPVDPFNGQQLEPMQDVVVIKGLIPIENITLNNQTYYVIVADGIKSEYIADLYTSKELIPDLVNAMNTPGTTAELLPKLTGNTTLLPANSPIFYYPNETGTAAFETELYQYGSDFIGGYVLVLPNNKTIIPYGIIPNPSGLAFLKFTAPKQVYNPYS